MNQDIQKYNDAQTSHDNAICDLLGETFNEILTESESKIWHGHPVWFLEGNPVVGYAKLKNSVQLLFWSGQSFEGLGLTPEGSFKAAEIRYASIDQIDVSALKRWLTKARNIQWDYKNIVKHRGVLKRLK